MTSAGAPIARWRPSVPVLLLLWTLSAGFVGIAAAAATAPGPLADRLTLSAAFLAFAAAAALPSTVRIDLHDDRLVLKGARRQARTIPIEKVRSATAGRQGLTFQVGLYARVSGPWLIGTKSRASQLLGITTGGDRIAAAVMSHAEAFRTLHPDPRPEIEQVIDDLMATLTVAGNPAEAAWLGARGRASGTTDGATRRELRDAARPSGRFSQVYLGTNRRFFDERLSRLAVLLADDDL